MCDTVLRPNYYDGRTLDSFLRDALRLSSVRKQPKLTVGTLQRLAGHIDPGWLSEEVAEMLDTEQCSDPGNKPIDLLIAPALRDQNDFRDCGGVVARIALAGHDKIWQPFTNILPDEATGKIAIVVDELLTVVVDPRSPTIWPKAEYDMIKSRDHLGQGRADRISHVAKASVRLSGFSESPAVSESYVSSVLRDFV